MGPSVLLLFKLRGCPTNVHAIVTVKRGQIININFKGVAKEPRVSNSKTKLTTQRKMNSDWSSSLRIIKSSTTITSTFTRTLYGHEESTSLLSYL